MTSSPHNFRRRKKKRKASSWSVVLVILVSASALYMLSLFIMVAMPRSSSINHIKDLETRNDISLVAKTAAQQQEVVHLNNHGSSQTLRKAPQIGSSSISAENESYDKEPLHATSDKKGWHKQADETRRQFGVGEEGALRNIIGSGNLGERTENFEEEAAELTSDSSIMENNDDKKANADRHMIAQDIDSATTSFEHDSQFHEEDPDGLKRLINSRWERSDCLYNETLLPPKIHQLMNEGPLIPPRSTSNNRPFTGVLLDAARHYFPIKWLYGLIDFLAILGYDWIHFRIVDDQSFVLKLDCHPELAVAVHPTRTDEIYSAVEMRAIVQYAKSKGIAIIPEVNVPGHAGGWQGIPGMLIPCVEFICQQGVGMPLNVDEPKVLSVVEDVLREVLDIFSTAPYLHLGGDELWMSAPCLNELQAKPNFDTFEAKLEDMLVHKLNYSADKIIRWEQTDHTSDNDSGGGMLAHLTKDRQVPHRAGKITHWWLRTPPNQTEAVGQKQEREPFFISTDLYFDVSENRDAWDIYQISKERFGIGDTISQPLAVLPATFELGPCTWNVRNVWGKLVAVAMAASAAAKPEYRRKAFMINYVKICGNVGLPGSICTMMGRPLTPSKIWKVEHKALQGAWRATVCDRLTEPQHALRMRNKTKYDSGPADPTYASDVTKRVLDLRGLIERAVKSTGEDAINGSPPEEFPAIHQSHVYNYTGVMIDLAHNYFEVETIYHIVDVMSMLGFNLLHLCLVENEFFAIRLMDYEFGSSYTSKEVQLLVTYAAQRGVKVMPEINFLSNAGGWHRSGMLVNCPLYICNKSGPIPMDILRGRSITTLSAAIANLLVLFNTSPFFHMGSFDQQAAGPCYQEAYPLVEMDLKKPFLDFEQTMVGVFKSMGLNNDHILGYESSNDDSSRKLGGIMHFYQTTPMEGSATSGPFFLSADVSLDAIGDDNAWDIYQHTRASFNSGASGAIVGTNRMDTDAWKSQNILGRLIAIAAGLASSSSAGETMDETEFRAHYATTCATVGLSVAACDSFGKPVSSAEAWEAKRDSLEMELQAKRCEAITHEGVSRLPRTSIFG